MAKEDHQIKLFDSPEWWEDEWEGMPEFVQDNLSPFNEVVVKFRDRKDMEMFMKLVEQKFTMKTKSIWYPKLEIKKVAHLRYIDES